MMNSPPKELLRRNGKKISCEPCRTSKIRCDHARPICARCKRRGLSSKCYYHPAPLTRPRNRSNSSVDCDGASPIWPVESETSPAYLGSTSFLSMFEGMPLNLSAPMSPQLGQWSGHFTKIAPRLVRLLSSLELYDKLITIYYAGSQFAIIPGFMILTPLRMTRVEMEKGRLSEDSWSRVTRNTAAKSMRVDATTTLEGFYSLFTGDNLRWEFIGLMFALAGLGALASPHENVLSLEEKQLSPDSFAVEMAAASNACLEICKQYDTVNDLTIWLYYTQHVLASEVFGETNHHVYSLFGEVVSHIHAMGTHRDSTEPNAPFFLSEFRKRLFAASYRADKNLATFLGRPPRLPFHFCDATLPLDIEDECLITGPPFDQLRPDGWSHEGTSNGRLRRATVIRLRYMVSVLREQVIGLSLGRRTATFTQDLETTYSECKLLWTTIPTQFHYSQSCWQLLDPTTCVISLVIYLEYLHTVTQIERLRCRQNPEAMGGLLDSSMQIVSAVIDVTCLRGSEGSKIRKQYAWIFLLYALPAAGVLATELHRSMASGVLPCSVPRSRVIRHLSLLVSWVGSVRPSVNATHKACLEVNAVITRLLDEALNQPRSVPDNGLGILDESVDNLPSFDSSVDFLNWLDELGFDASVPGLLL